MKFQKNEELCIFDEESLEKLSDNESEWEEEGFKKSKRGCEDSIKIYFKEAYSHKLLTREEEIQIGMEIEKNERKILKESLNYRCQLVKFKELLNKGEKYKRFLLIFKDYEEFSKDKEKSQLWLKTLKNEIDIALKKNKRSREKYIDKIINLIYEIRPTKFLLEKLSYEILETYKKIDRFYKFKQKFKNIDENIFNNIISTTKKSELNKYFQNICSNNVNKTENIIKELNDYLNFFKKIHTYFEASLKSVYTSGENICRAFQEIKKYKEKLVKANLRLIISLARKYSSTGMFLSDLIQEGNIGLLKAVEKFDYRKGFKFSTYATWWIRQSITRYLAENTRTIRVPVHIIETIYKISKVISTKFYQEYGRDPTLDELSKETGYPIEKLNYVFKVMKQPISLETTIGDDEDTTLEDFIENQNAVKPDEVTFNTALSEKVRELLKFLSPREEKIIRLRFGIGEKEAYTLEEVGNKFGVTKERIRQIESMALRKLKHPNKIKLLKNFLIYGS